MRLGSLILPYLDEAPSTDPARATTPFLMRRNENEQRLFNSNKHHGETKADVA